MRVLFDHPSPFALTHGGFQTQIEQTKIALEKAEVAVEYLRWWDESQKGDIIHFFGRVPEIYIELAHTKGFKVVMAELLTETGSRSAFARWLQKSAIRVARHALPSGFRARLAWESYRTADAMVALTPWESHLMATMFGAAPERIHVIPNGVEDVFIRPRTTPESWLVCTATLVERKRVLELAQAAVSAKTPIWIIGKPYSERDPYYLKFRDLVSAHPGVVRFEGAVSDRTKLAEIYQRARGFVLLSAMESLSLSALEAAAAGCPLLLSDLPWARTSFGESAHYCPISTSVTKTASVLREFYHRAPGLPAPPLPTGWPEIGRKFKSLYERLLNTSR